MSNRIATSALERAITYLGAVEVAPGRYAYRDDATHRYYVVTADVMERLPQYLDAEDDSHTASHGGYSEWCADHLSAAMPRWWRPEQRCAWRVVPAESPNAPDHDDPGPLPDDRYPTLAQAEDAAADYGQIEYERITADLETGAEAPV